MEDVEIWQVGDEVVGRPRGKNPLARADFEAISLIGLNLSIEADAEVHPRHANVCGWPKEKDEQKALALDLCAQSKLRLRQV
jgi:hypothetical protein